VVARPLAFPLSLCQQPRSTRSRSYLSLQGICVGMPLLLQPVATPMLSQTAGPAHSAKQTLSEAFGDRCSVLSVLESTSLCADCTLGHHRQTKLPLQTQQQHHCDAVTACVVRPCVLGPCDQMAWCDAPVFAALIGRV
jgi:hypothetical protein